MMNTNDKVQEDIAYFMRRLYDQKLTTTSGGNLSLRIGDNIYITPSGLDKANISVGQVGKMNMYGDIVGRKFKPSIESAMHLAIYRKRPDIHAIVHAHPVTTCTFAATDLKINTRLGSESYAILGDISYAGYALMGTEELALQVADASADSNCIVMRNHGALTVGKSILEAFDRLEVLENAAIMTLNTLMLPKANILELEKEELEDIDCLMGRN